MSVHPVAWLHSHGFLDAEQVQAFDAFQSLLEVAQSYEIKSFHFGRLLVDAGRSRLTAPEKATDARSKIRRALETLQPGERQVVIALTLGKSIATIERQLGIKPRKAKAAIQSALATLGAEWPFLDRRRSREPQS